MSGAIGKSGSSKNHFTIHPLLWVPSLSNVDPEASYDRVRKMVTRPRLIDRPRRAI